MTTGMKFFGVILVLLSFGAVAAMFSPKPGTPGIKPEECKVLTDLIVETRHCMDMGKCSRTGRAAYSHWNNLKLSNEYCESAYLKDPDYATGRDVGVARAFDNVTGE